MKSRCKGLLAASVMALAFAFTAPVIVPETAVTAYAAETYTVSVSEGYLALRNAKAYDRNNEIGKLYSGDAVSVMDSSDATYWYVYAGKLNTYGYVNKNYLVRQGSSEVTGTSMTVKVDSGYLALRTAKAFDYNNEIGKLYTGDTVQVTDVSDAQYWYVYAPSLGKSGYVNKSYLVGAAGSSMSVKVDSGYLALRTAKAFDYNNEIGKLYTGDTVQLQDVSDNQYWYVYAPSLGKSGYVNRDYLYVSQKQNTNPVGGTTKTVRVESGYLALRTAKAYDASNEIGKLYTGETVQVTDTSDAQYWYVYAPSLGKSGYVNKDYLYDGNAVVLFNRTVKVDSGYLALRNAKAFDSSNEIGKLYTGESVQVIDNSGSQYWYVYAPSLGQYGYVNKDYLY